MSLLGHLISYVRCEHASSFQQQHLLFDLAVAFYSYCSFGGPIATGIHDEHSLLTSGQFEFH
jgi:hypothetical protein